MDEPEGSGRRGDAACSEVWAAAASVAVLVVVVTVAGKATAPFKYTYASLIALPSIADVSPLSGPTQGGTLVTVVGSRFQYQGTVTFVDADGNDVGVCDWRTAGSYGPQAIVYVTLEDGSWRGQPSTSK